MTVQNTGMYYIAETRDKYGILHYGYGETALEAIGRCLVEITDLL